MKKNRLTRSKKLIILLASAVLVLALLALIAPFLILAGLFQTNPTSHPSQAALGWLAFDYTTFWRAYKLVPYDVNSDRWTNHDSDFHRTRSFREIKEIKGDWITKNLLAAKERAEAAISSEEIPLDEVARSVRFFADFNRFPEALDILKRAIRKLQGVQEDSEIDYEKAPRVLLRRLAGIHIREAENRNTKAIRKCESYLFPSAEPCIHQDPAPAREALKLYSILAERYPDECHFRWLAGVAASAAGVELESLAFDVPMPKTGYGPFPRLTDVAEEVGLVAQRAAGGAILDDFNGDGFFDVFLGSCLSEDPLLYFEGKEGGTFVERSSAAGLDGLYGAFRMRQADYDNDGDLDVFINCDGMNRTGRKTLLQNDGTGRFRDVTAEVGLDVFIEATVTSAWGDYDNDGWLDLFVSNIGTDNSCRLYRNNRGRSFSDITEQAGIPALGRAQSGTWGDYDQDGDVDLFLSIFTGPNYMFRNNGDGTFSDVTFEAGVSQPYFSFAAWFCD